MWALTIAQMRRSVGRLTAVGIAIALGAAFITATFVTTSTIESTALAAARAGIGNPDVIVQAPSTGIDSRAYADIAGTAGVTAIHPVDPSAMEATTGGTSEYVWFSATTEHEDLAQVGLTQGRAPAGPGEIALPVDTAERIGAVLDGSVTLLASAWDTDARPSDTYTVVGLTNPGSGLGFGTPLGLATLEQLQAWYPGEDGPIWNAVTLLTDPGASVADVKADLLETLPDATFLTGTEYAQGQAASFTGGVSIFRGLILSFAAVALAVAGIVIANTFTVLVAQRTRTLALLRCLGSSKAQVRRSVRLESLLLGVIASLVGIVTGLVIGQIVLSVLRIVHEGVPLPAVVPVDVWTVLVPFVAGVAVTVVAASGAARLATKVAPLAALRPVDAPEAGGRRRFRTRGIVGWIVAAVGLALMIAAVAWSNSDPSGAFEIALMVGVLGGIITMIGIIMAAVTIIPACMNLLGRITSRLGRAPQRLAATNAARNPARTTSTATALIVGVSLVTMMATGAATARSQLDTLLDGEFAVDATVTAAAGEQLAPGLVAELAAIDGVRAAAPLTGTTAEVITPQAQFDAKVWRVSDISGTLEVIRTIGAWDRGFAVLADGWLLSQDAPVSIGEADSLPGHYLPGLPDVTALVDDEAWAATGLTEDTEAVWLAVSPNADPRDVLAAIQDVVGRSASDVRQAPAVEGGVVERAGFAQVIDTLLLVVVGLLGVAVVIALIGVANTLSLSVVERRQENALLRALGLTRRQLRAALATEGVLLALVGTLVGIVLGLAFGFFGSTLLLGVVGGGARLVIPWGTLALVLGVAVAAGVIASVLPARSALKVPPVVALGA